MSIKTIAELKASSKDGRGTPYATQVIKVCVVKIGHTASFTTSSGEEMKMMNFSVADATDCALATLSDLTKAPVIKEGASLHIRNFLWKGKVVMTKNTKIFMAPKVLIPQGILENATVLICPPSPLTPVKDIGRMPSGKLATIKGKVIKDECVKTVKVQTVDTNIHTIRIEEDGNEISVSLWRELADIEVRVGDFVQVTQCVKGEYLRQPQLNSTRNTVVSKVEMPSQEVIGMIEGISQDGNKVEVAINIDGNYSDFIIDVGAFLEAFSMEEFQEDVVMEMMPVKIKATVQGGDMKELVRV